MSEKTPYQIMREQQKDVIEKQRQEAERVASVWKANQDRNTRLEELRIKEENARKAQQKRTNEVAAQQRSREIAQSTLDDDILVPSKIHVIEDTKCSSDYSTPSPASSSHSTSHSSCDGGGSSGSDSGSCSGGGGGCD